MQLLNNLFKVCWKWKNTDIIRYKLTSLVSLQQVNVKKSKKLMKANENSQYWRTKSSYFLSDLRNLNEIFRKDVPYDNTKSHKKPGFILSLEDTFLKKPQRRSDWPSAFLGLLLFSWMFISSYTTIYFL